MVVFCRYFGFIVSVGWSDRQGKDAKTDDGLWDYRQGGPKYPAHTKYFIYICINSDIYIFKKKEEEICPPKYVLTSLN